MLNDVGWCIVGTHSVYHSWCSLIPSVVKRFPCASYPFHDPLVTEELQLFCRIIMVVIIDFSLQHPQRDHSRSVNSYKCIWGTCVLIRIAVFLLYVFGLVDTIAFKAT
jgi:hypothetical protein